MMTVYAMSPYYSQFEVRPATFNTEREVLYLVALQDPAFDHPNRVEGEFVVFHLIMPQNSTSEYN
jgi:hypothetical protein